jgi:hypothetical protein
MCHHVRKMNAEAMFLYPNSLVVKQFLGVDGMARPYPMA